MNRNEAICFDDILLAPQRSKIESRKEINISMYAGGLRLDLPVIAAPMDTVCGDKMAMAMADRGGLGVIHRHQSIEDQVTMIKNVSDRGYTNVFGSVGINGDMVLEAKKLINAGASGLCIDVANGHNERTIEAVRILSNEFDTHIMAGNVSTGQGFLDLAEAGANSVRVGIGGGSMCTTRIVTGHGLPTLQSIIDVEVARSSNQVNCALIADGGIRNSGDMVKAFALGADFVMVGSMLAGTNESPGEIIGGQKVFRGMASESAQNDTRGYVSVVEGAETTVPLKGPVGAILESIAGGLRSGCSYSGVKSLSDLWMFADVRRISANSISENVPHGVR
jgi:IMP dehydrogenase